MIIKMIIY